MTQETPGGRYRRDQSRTDKRARERAAEIINAVCNHDKAHPWDWDSETEAADFVLIVVQAMFIGRRVNIPIDFRELLAAIVALRATDEVPWELADRDHPDSDDPRPELHYEAATSNALAVLIDDGRLVLQDGCYRLPPKRARMAAARRS